jgi:FkbM family methyltransferase
VHSQYGEDVFILQHFGKRHGHFLDVGAYDGVHLSNTRCLMEAGWTGVCLEPSPFAYPWLAKNVEKFPGVEAVEAAIVPDTSSVNGKVRFWAVEDALSTTDPRHKAIIEGYNSSIKYQEITVPAMKWTKFLEAHPGPYDFINIDVEGMNWEVLRDGPLAEMMCIELDPQPVIPQIKEHLRFFGLSNQREIGGNLLAWK